MATFCIKHRDTGKLVNIINCNQNNDNIKLTFIDDPKTMSMSNTKGKHSDLMSCCNDFEDMDIDYYSDPRSRMKFSFIPVDREWGYLKHMASGKIVRPLGGGENPDNFTPLVVHEKACPGALFAIDQINDCFVHKSGKYVHPQSLMDKPFSEAETGLILHHEKRRYIQFQIVSPYNTDQEFFLNGNRMLLMHRDEVVQSPTKSMMQNTKKLRAPLEKILLVSNSEICENDIQTLKKNYFINNTAEPEDDSLWYFLDED